MRTIRANIHKGKRSEGDGYSLSLFVCDADEAIMPGLLTMICHAVQAILVRPPAGIMIVFRAMCAHLCAP